MTSSADISFNRTQISNEASQKRVYCPYIKSLILSALLNEFAWEQIPNTNLASTLAMIA